MPKAGEQPLLVGGGGVPGLQQVHGFLVAAPGLPGLPRAPGNHVPGSGQSAPVVASPSGAIAAVGGVVPPLIVREPLVSVSPNSDLEASGTSVTRIARIFTPSARLVCQFSVGFEPTDPQVIDEFNTTPTWTAVAMRTASPGGREVPLHTIFSAQTLPQAYQVEGMSDIRVSALCTIPDNSSIVGSLGQPGVWVLEVRWDAGCAMCPEEILALYQLCKVTPPAARVPLQIPAA